MLILFMLLTALVMLGLGIFIGARISRGAFHGAMIIDETPEGMTFRMEYAGDPELLVFEDYVVFKVVGPDYESLLRGGN